VISKPLLAFLPDMLADSQDVSCPRTRQRTSTRSRSFRPNCLLKSPGYSTMLYVSPVAQAATLSLLDRACCFRAAQWVEQPENIPTALAVVPNRVEQGVLALIKKSKCSSWK